MHERKDCFLEARSWGLGPQAGRVSPYSTQLVQRSLAGRQKQLLQVSKPSALFLFTQQPTGPVCHWLLYMVGTPFWSNSDRPSAPVPLSCVPQCL